MIYGIGDIPVGTYDASRLANLGIGHGALDGGVGYTYFDPKTGHEFSIVTGLTYNLINPSTGCQNGIDWHVDWGASQFVTKTVQIGAVGTSFSNSLAIVARQHSWEITFRASRQLALNSESCFPSDRCRAISISRVIRGVKWPEPGGRLERVGDAGIFAEVALGNEPVNVH